MQKKIRTVQTITRSLINVPRPPNEGDTIRSGNVGPIVYLAEPCILQSQRYAVGVQAGNVVRAGIFRS